MSYNVSSMAGPVSSQLVEPIARPQHFVPPSARELRAQAVHRLQVGLFGLCAMLLLVGLANIISDRVGQNAPIREPIQQVVAVDSKPQKQAADPLADIGVVPAADPTPSPVPSENEAGDPLVVH
ncbi:MAG TPA: hypothetical protein VJQ77_00945 [Novosphingobium sp.]|nr:hypothetical protein [Novosphingobium sp.]